MCIYIIPRVCRSCIVVVLRECGLLHGIVTLWFLCRYDDVATLFSWCMKCSGWLVVDSIYMSFTRHTLIFWIQTVVLMYGCETSPTQIYVSLKLFEMKGIVENVRESNGRIRESGCQSEFCRSITPFNFAFLMLGWIWCHFGHSYLLLRIRIPRFSCPEVYLLVSFVRC